MEGSPDTRRTERPNRACLHQCTSMSDLHTRPKKSCFKKVCTGCPRIKIITSEMVITSKSKQLFGSRKTLTFGGHVFGDTYVKQYLFRFCLFPNLRVGDSARQPEAQSLQLATCNLQGRARASLPVSELIPL